MSALSNSDKAKMQAARELIREYRYAEARDLLEGVDHPTAERWRAKLDEIAPTKSSQSALPMIVIVLIIVAVIVGAIWLIQNKKEEARAEVRLFAFCLMTNYDLPEGYRRLSDHGDCRRWQTTEFEARKSEIMACHQQSPVLDTSFEECLLQEGILPPGVYKR